MDATATHAATNDATLIQALETLDAIERRRYALHYAMASIEWLAETADPELATAGRGIAVSELNARANEELTSRELGEVLSVMAARAHCLSQTDAARLRVLKRDRKEQMRVPPELTAKMDLLTNESFVAWRKAKQRNQWDLFSPYLEQLVALAKEIAGYIDPKQDAYDVYLHLHEQNSNRAFYDAFFDELKATIVPLVAKLGPAEPKEAVWQQNFDLHAQWELSRDLVVGEGLNPQKLVMGLTEHPFSEGIDSSHVFIATHLYETDVLSNVFSMLHEGGHALYEAGVDPAYDQTCLRGGTSMGMHESQSRFFENCIGRSRAYAGPLLAALAGRFGLKLEGVTADDLYRAANQAQPSLIRTEADELTYALHVMVRYEVEKRLFDGSLEAADVPAAWDELYASYLGISVPDVARGALQDVHWSQGMFGYFPTYALGSAYAAQFLHAMRADIDVDAVAASGDLAPICAWLEERVWRWGRAKDPAEIIEDACGEPFSATYYTNYLADKFGELLDLEG